MRLSLDVSPGFAFLDLASTKALMRVEGSDEDAFIEGLIEAAAQHIEGREGVTRKQFRQASYTVRLPVSEVVELPLPPLVSVESVSTVDEDGVSTAFTSHEAHADAYVGRVVAEWPDDACDVVVSYTCGHPDQASIPAPVRRAAELMVAHWHEHREAAAMQQIYPIPMGVKDMLKPYSVPHDRRR